MNCKKYIDLLPLYVTGDLDKPERDDVEAHLEQCENCREELQKYSELASLLKSASSNGITEVEKLKLENDIYRAMAKKKIANASKGNTILTTNLLRVAAAIIIFFIGFGAKALLTEPEANKMIDNQVMLTSLEKTGNQRFVSSGLRFSKEGFKLIAGGKSAEKLELNNN